MTVDQAALSADDLGKRIKYALARRGEDAAWLSRQTGIPTSTISDWSRGKLPRVDKAVSVATALHVGLDWLLTGNGGASPSDDPPEAQGAKDRRLSWRGPQPDRSDHVEVAEIDLRYGLGAAFLDQPVDSQKRTFSRAWLRNWTDSAPEQLFWARGQGDSMEPMIAEGDIVLIDREQVTPAFADLTWAFAFGEIGMIKRLRPLPGGSVKILSNNPSVPPETAAEHDLHIIGRVVAVVKKL